MKMIRVLAGVCTVAAIAVLLSAALRITFNEANERERQKTQRIWQLTKDGFIGLPAGEEYLKDDSVYWVNVSTVETWPDHTNNLSLLNEVKIISSSDYRHSREVRMFSLSKSLDWGYYRVKRFGTNVLYEPVPEPVRSQ